MATREIFHHRLGLKCCLHCARTPLMAPSMSTMIAKPTIITKPARLRGAVLGVRGL
jgi:hypothetical protein